MFILYENDASTWSNNHFICTSGKKTRFGCNTLLVNILLSFMVVKREDNLSVVVMKECCC